jgi:hypothetical protein
MVIVIGVAPFLAEGIVTAAANAVTGADLHPHLKIWHGVTPALWMSSSRWLAVRSCCRCTGRSTRIWIALPRPEAKAIFDRLVAAIVHRDPCDHRSHPQRRDQPLSRHLHRDGRGRGLDRLFIQRPVGADPGAAAGGARSLRWAGSC